MRINWLWAWWPWATRRSTPNVRERALSALRERERQLDVGVAGNRQRLQELDGRVADQDAWLDELAGKYASLPVAPGAAVRAAAIERDAARLRREQGGLQREHGLANAVLASREALLARIHAVVSLVEVVDDETLERAEVAARTSLLQSTSESDLRRLLEDLEQALEIPVYVALEGSATAARDAAPIVDDDLERGAARELLKERVSRVTPDGVPET